MTVDSRDLAALIAVGLGFVALFGLHLTVALSDIRRELRALRRDVRTTTHAAREAANAGRAVGIAALKQHHPAAVIHGDIQHPTSPEEPK